MSESIGEAIRKDAELLSLDDLLRMWALKITPARLFDEVRQILDDPKTPFKLRTDLIQKQHEALFRYTKAKQESEQTEDDMMRAAEDQMDAILANEYRYFSIPGDKHSPNDPEAIAKAAIEAIKEISYSHQWTAIGELIARNLATPPVPEVASA